MEGLKKFPAVIQEGEPVIVTEKIHGANARYLWDGNVFYIGSRTNWLKPDVSHPWKRAVDLDARIQQWCKAHPGVVLYGEIYGAVQLLKYGCKPGEIRFAAFAALQNGEWLDTGLLLAEPIEAISTVPVVYRGPYNQKVLELAEEDSSVPGAEPGHMREGLVIVPEHERRDDTIGRVALKHISSRYWESAA